MVDGTRSTPQPSEGDTFGGADAVDAKGGHGVEDEGHAHDRAGAHDLGAGPQVQAYDLMSEEEP